MNRNHPIRLAAPQPTSHSAGAAIRLAAVAWSLAVLTGCAAGPDFKRPDPPQVDRYLAEADPVATVAVDGREQRFTSAAEIAPDWWRIFDSKELDALIATGLKNSPNLAAAQATLTQSERNLNAGQGVFYPEVDLGFGFARQRLTPLRQGIGGPGTVFGLYTLSTAVSYTLDIFGAERRTVEGLEAQVDFQRASFEAAYLSLVGNIINTAIAAAAYRTDVEATERLIALQQEQLSIVEAQANAGLVSAASVVAVKSQLAANQAVLPTISQRRVAAEDLLSTLLGFAPAQAKLPKLAMENLRLPVALPVSLPSSLIRQRPDILAAEASLHAASAQIGVATAELFPTVTLSANYGVSSTRAGDLNDPNGRFWSAGPNMTFPLFQGGSAWNRKDAAVAGYESTLAKYRQAVLSAFGQVADTLQALSHDAETAAARQKALELVIEQTDLVSANHDAGIVGDLEWLISRQQIESARMAMTDATALRYQDTVALYVAMGGGWWNTPCPDMSAPKYSCHPLNGEGTPVHEKKSVSVVHGEVQP